MRTREERRMLTRIKFIAKIKKIFNEYGKYQVQTWDKLITNTKWARLYKNTRTWQKKFVTDKIEVRLRNKRERMKSKRILLLGLVICLFSSCSETKTFEKSDGSTIVAEPYGWANSYKKIDGVIYEPNFPDIIFGVIGAESIFIPIYVTGWDIMEPVKYVDN